MTGLVPPSGHERYIQELADLLDRDGPPDQAAIAELRASHDIQQLTPLIPGRPGPPSASATAARGPR